MSKNYSDRAAHPSVTASGNIPLTSLDTTVATSIATAQRFPVMVGQWETAVPRTLQLSTQQARQWQPGRPFPPSDVFNLSNFRSWRAGLINADGTLTAEPFQGVVCQLEYGSYSSAQVVYFDWQCGTYNLPPLTYVRVTALVYGNFTTAQKATSLEASCSMGQLECAAPPVVSGPRLLTAVTEEFWDAPVGARAFDVLGLQAGITPVVTASCNVGGVVANYGPFISRNYATGVFVPPWGPVQVSPGVRMRLYSDIDAWVDLRWFLQL